MAGFKIHNHQQAHFITFGIVDWIDVFTHFIHLAVLIGMKKGKDY